MSPLNCANLHACMDFSLGSIKLMQRVHNPKKMKNFWYRQCMLERSQQIGHFQIKWPRKAGEEVGFLLASKGAEFHRPKLTEMVCFQNGRWVSWGPKLMEHQCQEEPRTQWRLLRQGGNTSLRVTHNPHPTSALDLVALTSFLISFSSTEWWYRYHPPHMLLWSTEHSSWHTAMVSNHHWYH